MPLGGYALLALVRELLPAHVEQADGAVLTAQGASSIQGLPNMSRPGPARAVQRNYLQSLHAEVGDKGVYVAQLYVGAAIQHSAFCAEMQPQRPPGRPFPEMPIADPAHLADLLWIMYVTKTPEATYPQGLFDR